MISKILANIKKPPEIPPADHLEFRKTWAKVFGLQLAILIPAVSFYHWTTGQKHPYWQVLSLVLLVLGCFYLQFKLKPSVDFRKRLRHLYPGEPLPNFFDMGFLNWIPLVALGIHLYLMWKEKSQSQRMPLFFRHPHISVFLILCALVALFQIPLIESGLSEKTRFKIIPAIEYAVFPPAVFLVSTMLNDSSHLKFHARNLANNKDPSHGLPEHFEMKTSASLHSGQGFLKERSRPQRAELKIEETEEVSVEFLEESAAQLEEWHKRQPPLYLFNPMNFVFPASVMEASLVSGLEHVSAVIAHLHFVQDLERLGNRLAKSKNPKAAQGQEFVDKLRKKEIYETSFIYKKAVEGPR